MICIPFRDGSACLSYTKTKSENTQGGEPVYEDKWIEYIDAENTALPLRYDQVHTYLKDSAFELSAIVTYIMHELMCVWEVTIYCMQYVDECMFLSFR